MNKKILTDSMSISDKISNNSHKSGFWAKTQIIAGHGLHKNSQGISELDEVVFETTNMVPIGGVQYAMEMIFGIKNKDVNIPDMYSQEDLMIGVPNDSEFIPKPSNGMPYPYGERVCLFGVGIDGAAADNLTALDVKYNEFRIGSMVPFRCLNSDELTETEKEKYFGKKEITTPNSLDAYYLKAFEDEAQIYHYYKTGKEGEDGIKIENAEAVFNTEDETSIESFTECILKITTKDVREWFELYGNIEVPRINSIALFHGIYVRELNDYANIRLFSKLNIPTEPLSLTKDMEIIYRVYGS